MTELSRMLGAVYGASRPHTPRHTTTTRTQNVGLSGAAAVVATAPPEPAPGASAVESDTEVELAVPAPPPMPEALAVETVAPPEPHLPWQRSDDDILPRPRRSLRRR